MFAVPLATTSSTLTSSQFWNGVLVYYNRPHLVNRKLAGISQVLFYELYFNSKDVKKVTELFTRAAVLYESRKLKTLSKENITADFIRNVVECYDKNVKLEERSVENFKNASKGIFISIRILLPRTKGCERCVEIVVLDKNDHVATFVAAIENNKVVIAPAFPYHVELTSSGNLRIVVESIEDADTNSAEWLADKVFYKVVKWASESDNDKDQVVRSLGLIDIEQYCMLYSKLKEKYAAAIIKVWHQKAKTDPQKYIHEDIAIASYLICLWEKYTRKEEVRFLDVGCGNGLLVHLLNQEGYQGYGVDLRRRDTWDLYDSSTQLKVGVINAASKFPESNWLIGNHSDELTPWIPIMALKSSNYTNFFLLPCCPYELNGKKFIRTNSSVSQYSDYLDYVKKICKLCSFDTRTDKLRIPSTKRVCMVGLRKSGTLDENNATIEEVNKFISNKCATDTIEESFSPKPSTEKVRNCTQLDRNFVDNLISHIVKILLETNDVKCGKHGQRWNKGGGIHLGDLSERISKDDLKELKNECGGLQTLLKNHRYIFEVKAGVVSLRMPLTLSITNQYKDKPCWFQRNHPDGCLYDTECCAYKHE